MESSEIPAAGKRSICRGVQPFGFSGPHAACGPWFAYPWLEGKVEVSFGRSELGVLGGGCLDGNECGLFLESGQGERWVSIRPSISGPKLNSRFMGREVAWPKRRRKRRAGVPGRSPRLSKACAGASGEPGPLRPRPVPSQRGSWAPRAGQCL